MRPNTNNKAHHALRYSFTRHEEILFDANIWLYLLPSPAQTVPKKAQLYNTVLENLLLAQAAPIINVLVLGEYCNRYLRLEWSASSFATNFKAYRQSASSKHARARLQSRMQHMLGLCKFKSASLSSTDRAALLQTAASGQMDINDAMLIAACRQHSWKLLTHDADMQVGDIEVLTTNPKLLRACP